MSKATTSSRKRKEYKSQIHQYDKIFRENLEAALPGLVKKLLHIQATHTEEIPDDIQHTKERKPDVLKKVTDQHGETFVLHVEYQVCNEKEMVYRMAEYYIMLLRRYRIPVRQYVLYVGPRKSTMKDHMRSGCMDYKYQLIAFSSVDYRLLLRADNPEVNMMAILADFGKSDPQEVIKEIITRIIGKSNEDFSKQRHLRQLLTLAQLRNLGPQTLKIMNNITDLLKKEKDILYILGEKKGMKKGIAKGIEKGIEKGLEKTKILKAEIVRNLLLNTDFTISKIASLTKATQAFVKDVKNSIKK